VETLVAGEDPAAVAFDPSGSGKTIVTNAGDYTVTLFGEDPLAGTETAEPFQPVRSFPNPFSQSATIKFALPKAVHLRLAVYDVRGRLVTTMINENMEPGIHTVKWNGRDHHGRQVASGLYFCRLEAGEFVNTRKTMMLR